MNKQHHIEQLEHRIKEIMNEPIKGWIGRITKAVKIKNIERKIHSLKKRR